MPDSSATRYTSLAESFRSFQSGGSSPTLAFEKSSIVRQSDWASGRPGRAGEHEASRDQDQWADGSRPDAPGGGAVVKWRGVGVCHA